MPPLFTANIGQISVPISFTPPPTRTKQRAYHLSLDNNNQYVIVLMSFGGRILSGLLQVMRARLAVLKTPPKSSVSSLLPLYKSCALLSHPESTLLQVLIPLHFNSSTINVYKKPWGGPPPRTRKVLQLVTP